MDHSDSVREDACLTILGPDDEDEKPRREPDDEDENLRFKIGGLPENYFYDHSTQTIYIIYVNGQQPVCGPLRVAKVLRNLSGSAHALLIEFVTRDGSLQAYVLSVSDLMQHAGDVAAMLAELGLAVSGSPGQLARLLRQWVPTSGGLLAESPGWFVTDDQVAYVMPNGKVLTDSRESAPPIYTASGPVQEGSNSSGTFTGWYDGVATLSQHNPLLMFTIACALAGPLLSLFGLDSGGFNVHGRSSSGKTTVLFAAMSVFGSPAGMMRWNASAAAFETAARQATDSVLILDEIPTKSRKVARDLGPILYMLANGTGKGRSNRDLEHLPPATWRVILLTSAEAPLTQIFTSARLEMPEGLGVRLADIPAKSWTYGGFSELHGHRDPADFADAMKAGCSRDYGQAGQRFVEQLIATRQSTIRSGLPYRIFKSTIDEISRSLGASVTIPLDGPEMRVIRRLAAVSVAGQLACVWKIVPWTPAEVRVAILEISQLWLAQRRGLQPAPYQDIIDRAKAYFIEHADEFADVRTGEVFLHERHSGWHDGEKIAISPEVFAEEIAPPLTAGAAARQLNDHGILIGGGEARSLQQRRSQKIDPDRSREYWLRKVMLGIPLVPK